MTSNDRPSTREILFSFPALIKPMSKSERAIISPHSNQSMGLNVIGLIRLEILRMSRMLKILEPITFPTAMAGFFLIAAMQLATSSGNDVPNATANNEIKASEIPI